MAGPSPGPGLPEDDEYSRVTDPGRYRILDARVEAWVRVLVDASLADIQDVSGGDWIDGVRPASELLSARRLTPRKYGGLSLVVGDPLVDGASFGIDIGVQRDEDRTLLLDTIPDCGCDACDGGSAELLELIDGYVLSVTAGGIVHARDAARSVTRTGNGWKGRGQVDERWLDTGWSVPSDVDRWIGEPWGLPE